MARLYKNIQEQVEYNELIATRVPPGDQWVLVNDRNKVIHKSLTDALEAWFEANQEKAEFRLAPLDSKIGWKSIC